MEGLKATTAGDHVFQEPDRVRDPVFVDYSVDERRRERVREEAGRVFLHQQRLPSEMRFEVPQSAHHSHLRLFQALSGTKHAGQRGASTW